MADQPVAKRYYTIGEVSGQFGVAPSLIRYWESEFRQLHPAKSTKGDRRYTVRDIETIRDIFHLVKERGFTIEGARKELEQQKLQRKNEANVVEKLAKVREKLNTLLQKHYPED
jgi:DNA-binding transcriptional MerR regulator